MSNLKGFCREIKLTSAFNIALSSLGSVRTSTIKAFTIKEFGDIIRKIL